MADLQDQLHATTEVGELDDLVREPFPGGPFPPDTEEPYDLVSDPAAAPLDRAHAILAAHPVADGYSGLPWALRHLPWFDLELGRVPWTPTCPGCGRGTWARCSGRCTCPRGSPGTGPSAPRWSSSTS